jgi:Tfp pilus assembly protein PilN
MTFSSPTARLALILAAATLIFAGALAVTYSIQISGLSDRADAQQAHIVKLEKRLTDLECRHVRFEDGSTLHADADRVAECVYTAPVFAKYGD